jgi:uncharacterized protein (DUF924 family)
MTTADDVLDFWFGDGDPDDPAQARMGLWFGGSPALDAEIRDRFLAAIEAAATGRLEAWKESPRGRLAWIILLDQFTRNAFRESVRMYGYDPLALHAAREAMMRGQDRALPVVQRAFLYLPLEHAEERQAQDACVAAFETLAAQAPPALAGLVAGMVDYARRHAVVVDRFGRFPHRNALLCRPSSAEEEAFLASPAAPF